MATIITAENVGLQGGSRKAMEKPWHLVRTLRGGTTAMREAGEIYTPATKRERRQPERYQNRLQRSALHPMYSGTVRKIASLPFQKAPTISGQLPPSVMQLVGNADRKGKTLSSFLREHYTDAIDRGMGLFLVDNVSTLKANGSTMSQAEADAVDARPYFRRIHPDNLLRIECVERNGIDVPVLLTFRSSYWTTNANGNEVPGTRVEVWTEAAVTWWVDDGQQKFRIERETSNTIGKIPLVVTYTNQTGEFEAAPAMEDLAWMNVQHWNSLSMQDEALHFGRAPILKMTGVVDDPKKPPPEIGPGAVFRESDDQADIAFVEIAGTSLAAGEVQIEKIEKRAESLGMQPLTAVAGPTTATGEVRADSNEKSEAQSWIEALEWSTWRGFEFVAEWDGEELPDDGDFTLYRDSSIIAGKATDLPNIFVALDKSLITPTTALRELVLRGTIATVEDPEAEIADVQLESENQQANQLAVMQKQIEAERARAAAVGATDPNADPAAGGGAGGVTFNELTLGVERLMRAGNTEGANALLAQAADILGIRSLGRVTKTPAA